MDLSLVKMMVMHYDSVMGNLLAQYLYIWMDFHLVYMMVQS